MYATGMSTFEFVLYLSIIILGFVLKVYRERIKEQKSEITQLKKENKKLQKAVQFYHEQSDKRGTK